MKIYYTKQGNFYHACVYMGPLLNGTLCFTPEEFGIFRAKLDKVAVFDNDDADLENKHVRKIKHTTKRNCPLTIIYSPLDGGVIHLLSVKVEDIELLEDILPSTRDEIITACVENEGRISDRTRSEFQ